MVLQEVNVGDSGRNSSVSDPGDRAVLLLGSWG